jgi:hypothetical protein
MRECVAVIGPSALRGNEVWEVILDDFAQPMPILRAELDAIERHLGRMLEEFLSRGTARLVS